MSNRVSKCPNVRKSALSQIRGMPLTTVAPLVSSGNPFGVPDALPVTLPHTMLKLSQSSYLQYQANYSTQGFIGTFDSNTNSSSSAYVHKYVLQWTLVNPEPRKSEVQNQLINN